MVFFLLIYIEDSPRIRTDRLERGSQIIFLTPECWIEGVVSSYNIEDD